MAKIALNGFGRIGKLLLRHLVDSGMTEQVALMNIRTGAPELHAHLLEFDTVHGRWRHDIVPGPDFIEIDGHRIMISAESHIRDIPLKDMGIDLVLDCTGVHKSIEKTRPYYDEGVKKVLVSAPIKQEGVLNIVMGVNDQEYDPAVNHLVTAASCTTNCLAPVVRVLHEEIGILHGSMTTIHDVTNSQTIIDRPAKDLRRARSALNSLIPTTTGSASAITLIYPDLKGKLNGHAVRVPLLNSSLTDCVFEVKRETSVEEVNGLFRKWSEGGLKDILGYETRPLVSTDYTDDPRSSIIDAPSTMVVNGTHVKVYAWYDNEWGYTCRMGDVTRLLAASL